MYMTQLTKRDKKINSRKTKKKYGGRLHSSIAFSKILSIGYELETQFLTKLTLLDDDAHIFLNTTSNSKDYEIMKKNDFEDLENYENRLSELMELPSYTSDSIQKNKLKENTNTVFLAANDVAVHPFTNYLNDICEDAEIHLNKDKRYTLKTDESEYNITFESWSEQDCGTFSDVEWIMTYYKPYKNNNIIMNTFVNTIENLILHLDKLETTYGTLFIHFSENDREEAVPNPVNRKLFHLPDTNLYYLQTHFFNSKVKSFSQKHELVVDENIGIDDICIVPQMTFSCKIQDVLDIYKELLTNETLLEENKQFQHERLKLVEHIEECIHELFEKYNEVADSKIMEEKNPVLVKSMKNCTFLILFKLYLYYNSYLTKSSTQKRRERYLKDMLFFNSRHTNYDLYTSIKSFLSNYFPDMQNNQIIDITKKLIINKTILEKYMVDKQSNVRKNAFSLNNTLPHEHKFYGDPHYSLSSYFDFFENPKTENDDTEVEIFRDWLQFSNIDIYSSMSAIKDSIVLTEFRTFAKSIVQHIYDNADESMKEDMTKGICNKALMKLDHNIVGLSIRVLRKFVDTYNNSK